MFYRYGMNRQKIAAIKKLILEEKEKKEICQELKITFGKYGIVKAVIIGDRHTSHNIVCYLKSFEDISEGDRISCKDPDFGIGTVEQVYSDGDLMSVKFDIRELPTNVLYP